MAFRRWLAAIPATAFLAGCGSDNTPTVAPPPAPTGAFTREQLLDPKTCNQCHQDYFHDWSGSMHAYASVDPVFRAMNARGQRETHGDLGNFCVTCHAPMAVAEGATVDGLNLDSVPDKLQGVTCYFCHQVTEVIGTHNNPLKLANDTTMRGAIRDAVQYNGQGHSSAYSKLLDKTQQTVSSSLCGSCHDITVPGHFSGATDAGVPTNVDIERTYKEWRSSAFAPVAAGAAPLGAVVTTQSCGDCHMLTGEAGPIASPPGDHPAMPSRAGTQHHSHTFAAVDTALALAATGHGADAGSGAADGGVASLATAANFPNRAEQLQKVKALLSTELRVQVCVNSVNAALSFVLENRSAGHYFPSGASQDRRLWIEWHAYDKNGKEFGGSPVVPPGVAATTIASSDPTFDRLFIRDRATKADGTPATMFWNMARVEPQKIVQVSTLADPLANQQSFLITGLSGVPERLSATVWLEPIGLDVLDDLIASESPEIAAGLRVVRAQMPRFAVSPLADDTVPDAGELAQVALEWTKAAATTASRGTSNLCLENTPTLLQPIPVSP